MTTVMRMRGNDYLEKQTDMVHYFLFRLARDYFMEHGRISGEFRQGGKTVAAYERSDSDSAHTPASTQSNPIDIFLDLDLSVSTVHLIEGAVPMAPLIRIGFGYATIVGNFMALLLLLLLMLLLLLL